MGEPRWPTSDNRLPQLLNKKKEKKMFRKSVVIFTFLVAGTAAPVLANFDNGPEEAGSVFRFNFPFGASLVDAEAGLVALGGPPPELGCIGLGFEEADFQFVATPAGPVKFLIHDVQQFFIYEASSIGDVCEAALTTGIAPFAVGYAKVFFNDNFDNYEPGSRSNPFGGNANGTVYDADGNAWQFHGNLKLFLDREGNFEVIKETIRLKKHGK